MFQKISIYKRTGGWLFFDIVRTLKLSVFWVFLLSSGQVISHIGFMGSFIGVLQSVIKQEAVSYNFLDFTVTISASLGWVSAIFFFGIMAAFLIYVEAIYKNVVATRYAMDAMERVLDYCFQPAASFTNKWEKEKATLIDGLPRLLTGGASQISKAAVAFLSCFLPALILSVAIPILFYLSWELTLAMPFLLIFYVFPYFLLNRKIVRSSRIIEKNGRKLKQKIIKLIAHINEFTYGTAYKKNKESVKKNYLFSDELQSRIQNLQTLRTASNALQSLNNLFLVIFILMIVIVVINSENENILLVTFAYSLIIFQAYSALNKLTGFLTIFNRFLPQIERYSTILRNYKYSSKTGISPNSQASKYPVIRLDDPITDLVNSKKTISLQGGTTCAVLCLSKIRFERIGDFLQQLGGAKAFKSIYPFVVFDAQFHGKEFVAEQSSKYPVKDLLGISNVDHTSNNDRVSSMISWGLLSKEIAKFPNGLDSDWNDVQGTASATLKFLVAISAGLRKGCNTIIVPHRIWDLISTEQQVELRKCLSEIALILVCESKEDVAQGHFDNVIFMSADGILWLGESPSISEIEKVLHTHCQLAPIPKARVAENLDDDDDDDDIY